MLRTLYSAFMFKTRMLSASDIYVSIYRKPHQKKPFDHNYKKSIKIKRFFFNLTGHRFINCCFINGSHSTSINLRNRSIYPVIDSYVNEFK